VFHGEGERSERGFLGVSTQALSDQLADYFEAPRDRGVLVTRVERDSPADRAGIEAGDVILSVEDDPISSPGELRRAIRDRRPEATVEIGILRRGERRAVRATLGEVPDLGSLDWEGTGPGRFRVEIPRIHLEGLRTLGIPELENFELPDIDIPEIDIEGSGLDRQEMNELRDQLREHGHQLRDQLRKMGRDIGRQMRDDHSTLRERREAHREAMREAIRAAEGALDDTGEARHRALELSREAMERAREAMEADRLKHGRGSDAGTI
jgi:membrane-associated protease RseP (regulator of RpoE activity)